MIKKPPKKRASAASSGDEDTPRTNLKSVRKMMKGLGGNEKYWKPKSGENIIRILPSTLPDGNFAYEVRQHYGFRLGNEKRAFPCLLALDQDTCPACQLIAAYEDETDDDVRDALKKLNPSRQYMMNIIDRSDTNPRVKMYFATPGAMKEITAIIADSDYGDITDPDDGRDVKIKKTGDGPETRYKALARAKSGPVGVDDWNKHLFDLKKEAYREIPTLKEYYQYLEDSFGDIVDVSVIKSTRKKRSKRLIEDEDLEDEDEDVEEDDVEEDEEELKPKKKLKLVKPKRKKVVEEEDEEEDEEDADFE